jgi:Domain of unknown function (DUF4394)/FG-GAP-like repeat
MRSHLFTRWFGRTHPTPARLRVEGLEGRETPATIYALEFGNVLVRFDSANPNQVLTVGAITGFGANETARGIDFRPRTGQLYTSTVTTGSAANSVVRTYVLNPRTAEATFVGQTSVALPGAGDMPGGYDFNPIVDRIRYVNTNDENGRLNPNGGSLAGNDTNLTPAATTAIIAAAYDRPFDRQTTAVNNSVPATLYVIDRNDSQLGIQGGINGTPSPNGGVVTDLAPLGFSLNAVNDGGFDIASGPGLGVGFAALTDAADNLTRLYSINLVTAATATPVATPVGLIGNGGTEVRSIAVVPDSVVAVGTDAGTAGVARLLDSFSGAIHFTAHPYGSFTGGVRVAAGDVNGDGMPDLITAPGSGLAGGRVRAFDGLTGAALQDFQAFPGFAGGVHVASGDLNSDGFDDIIVGKNSGVGGQVKAFDGRTGTQLLDFLSFPGLPVGVRLAAADLDLDGDAEIIVGGGAGTTDGQVKVFDNTGSPYVTGAFDGSIFAFSDFSGGVFVAAGDVTGDGRADIVVGAGKGGGGTVRVFSGVDGTMFNSFTTFQPTFTGGVRVAVADANRDGRYEVAVTPGRGRAGTVRLFHGLTGQLLNSFVGVGYTGGIFVGGGRAL